MTIKHEDYQRTLEETMRKHKDKCLEDISPNNGWLKLINECRLRSNEPPLRDLRLKQGSVI